MREKLGKIIGVLAVGVVFLGFGKGGVWALGVKRLEVDLSREKIMAFEGSNLIYEFDVSTGIENNRTQRGTFLIYRKEPIATIYWAGNVYPNTPYLMYYDGAYIIHSAYWHNNFGMCMSFGCIHMRVNDAQQIYYWAPLGTPITIYGDLDCDEVHPSDLDTGKLMCEPVGGFDSHCASPGSQAITVTNRKSHAVTIDVSENICGRSQCGVSKSEFCYQGCGDNARCNIETANSDVILQAGESRIFEIENPGCKTTSELKISEVGCSVDGSDTYCGCYYNDPETGLDVPFREQGADTFGTATALKYLETCPPTPTPTQTPIPTPVNESPVLDEVVITDANAEVATADGSLRNQICESNFTEETGEERQVRFVVGFRDSGGADEIEEVGLKFKAEGVSDWEVRVSDLAAGGVWTSSGAGAPIVGGEGSVTRAGNLITVVFPVDFSVNFTGSNGVADLNDLYVYANDARGGTSGDVAVNRRFKVWDCTVDIEGSLYDGSEGSACVVGGIDTGFEVKSDEVFSSLAFTGTEMTISSPDFGGSLVWGGIAQVPVFNGGEESWSSEIVRIIDLGNEGGSQKTCPGMGSFVFDGVINPYSADPRADVDFSVLPFQEAWFQVVGGGLISKTEVESGVPASCSTDDGCQPAISIADESNGLANGVVFSAGGIVTSACESCTKGRPSDVWKEDKDMFDETSTYARLYQSVYQRNGIGVYYEVGTSMATIVSDLGGTGVAFVNGDVTVGSNISVADGSYLMVVAKGQMVIDQTVRRVEGIFVVNGLRIEGTSADQLVVEGSVISTNGINITRSYSDMSMNADSPAVVVRYRPDFLFMVPPKLATKLSGWKEGN